MEECGSVDRASGTSRPLSAPYLKASRLCRRNPNTSSTFKHRLNLPASESLDDCSGDARINEAAHRHLGTRSTSP